MERGEFILQYCFQLTEVLCSTEPIEKLSDTDYKLIDLINEYNDIDSHTLTERIRTDMEVLIYNECNKFVDSKFRSGIAFDIGSGIDCIECYFRLLRVAYNEKYNKKIPDTLINIKDLVVVRLRMIDLSSSSDQAMLLYKNKLENVVETYKLELDEEIRQTKKEVQSEVLKTVQTFNENLSEVENKKTDIYKDIITIISIFAGLILTFSGAFSFSSAILESIHLANFYKLIIVSSLICIFILSLFVGLYFFLYNIRYDYPLRNNKYDKTYTKDEIKRIRKDIRRHRLTLLVPISLVYLILTAIIFTVLIMYPAELSQNGLQNENDSIIKESE